MEKRPNQIWPIYLVLKFIVLLMRFGFYFSNSPINEKEVKYN